MSTEQEQFFNFEHSQLKFGNLKDTQIFCKTVERAHNVKFEDDIAMLLDDGYQISSTYCFCNDDGTLYQAILIKTVKQFVEK